MTIKLFIFYLFGIIIFSCFNYIDADNETDLKVENKLDNNSKCESIVNMLCQNLPYNQTVMPNFLGDETQDDASVRSYVFTPLTKFPECKRHLKNYICLVFIPVCSDSGEKIPPCRSVCRNARDDCEPLMNKFNIDWPTYLDCNVLPDHEENPDALCVGNTKTFSSWSLPSKITTNSNIN